MMDLNFLRAVIPGIIREIAASPKSLIGFTMPVNDATVNQFLALLQASNKPSTASWAVGVPWGEMKRYLDLGSHGIEPYRGLYERYMRSRALAEVQDNRVLTAMAQDGKVEAIKFRLQHRHGWQDKKTATLPSASQVNQKVEYNYNHYNPQQAVASVQVNNLDAMSGDQKTVMFQELVRERQIEKRLLKQLASGELTPEEAQAQLINTKERR
jgi:hypothetical protein